MNDPYVLCPYNASHHVPRSRIQYHIVKCQKNYPKLEICPYDATHRYPEEVIKAHVKVCPKRIQLFPEQDDEKVIANIYRPRPIGQRQNLPESDPNHEIWDD